MVGGILKDPWVEFICGPKPPGANKPDPVFPPSNPFLPMNPDPIPHTGGNTPDVVFPPPFIRNKREVFPKDISYIVNIQKLCAKKEKIIPAMQKYLDQRNVDYIIEMCNFYGNVDPTDAPPVDIFPPQASNPDDVDIFPPPIPFPPMNPDNVFQTPGGNKPNPIVPPPGNNQPVPVIPPRNPPGFSSHVLPDEDIFANPMEF